VKRKRFSVEQIVGILKQVEVGVPVADSPARCAASPKESDCGPGETRTPDPCLRNL